jgi:hypothetical protein
MRIAVWGFGRVDFLGSDRSIEEKDLEESTVFLRPAEVLVRGVD